MSGKTLKKGHILTSSDIGQLQYAGIKTVIGVQFSSDDIHPETAADILLKTMAGDYLRYTTPDENGYSEIFADIDGVFISDRERLNRFNAHSENISLMTVQPYLPVYKGQFVANLRLFGPAVTAETLNEAVTKISGTGPLLKVAPYAFCKIGFIRTIADKSHIRPQDTAELENVSERMVLTLFTMICANIAPRRWKNPSATPLTRRRKLFWWKAPFRLCTATTSCLRGSKKPPATLTVWVGRWTPEFL